MSNHILKLKYNFISMFIISIMICLGIWIGYGLNPIEIIPGLIIFVAISLLGLLMSYIIPIPFPAVGWVAVIGIVFSIPNLFPINKMVIEYTNKIPFIATATPALAFAGISVGKDWDEFKKIGWKGVFISLLVLTGTFLGSAIVSEVILRLTGKFS